MTALLVALGAAVGAPLRLPRAHHLDGRFPLGTLLVNVTGSAVLGLCTALALHGDALALLGTGFCGGLTTYSAFTVQAVDRGRPAGQRLRRRHLVVSLLAAAAGVRARRSGVAEVVQPGVVDPEVVGDLVDHGDADLVLELLEGVAEVQQRLAGRSGSGRAAAAA